MWIKTISPNQRPADLWLDEIMSEHYDHQRDTPDWFDTDDGYRKANWKEPVAHELVKHYPYEYVDEDEAGAVETAEADSTASDDTAEDADAGAD